MTLLKVDHVVAGYGAHDEILKGVDMDVRAREIVAVLGPNGAGKSTLLKSVAALVNVRSGRIELMGASLLGIPPREVSRMGVAFVPQEANIFPSLTVEENLEIGAYLEPKTLKVRRARVFERIPEIAKRRHARGGTLSGGQRQLLAMAMALMVEPKLMLLDEPTAGLSPVAAENLFEIVKAIRAEGVSVAMVEQNALYALAVADRAYILVDGKTAREGDAGDMARDAEIRRLFLGEDTTA